MKASNICPFDCNCVYDFYDTEGVIIDCRKQSMKTIPYTNIPRDTSILDLSQNTIQNIPVFPSENLRNLNLTMNNISIIEEDSFEDMQMLTSLSLSYNDLRSLEDQTFEWGPEKLEILKLDHNKIEVIRQNIFKELIFLEEIDLSYNRINYIHPATFKMLEKLKILKLNNNQLNIIHASWIGNNIVSGLTEVSLHSNPWLCDCGMLNAAEKFSKDEALIRWLDRLIIRRPKCSNESPSKTVDLEIFGSELLNKLEGCKTTQPIIEKISINQFNISYGTPLLLKCKASGNPKPEIEWEAPSGDIYKLTSDEFQGDKT